MTADWLTLCASLAAGGALLLLLWWRRHSQHFGRLGLPSVPPLPLVGNMLDVVLYRKSFTEVVQDLYQKLDPFPYGGVFSFTIPAVMVRDPELIRSVTVKNFDHFTDHMDFFTTDKANPLLTRMLFALKVSSQEEKILTLELRDFFRRVTNDVIATTAFGVKVDSLSEPSNEFFTTGRDLSNINPFVSFGYFISARMMEMLGIPFFSQKAVSFFKSLVVETIQTREKQGIIRHDMIHLLMQARRGELAPEDGQKNGTAEGKRRHLTDEDIAAQAMIFFFAGFDTVSTLLTFCSYLLATHEDVQRRLQREVDQLMEKSGGQPSYEQVTGCQYLDMVISETLRMYPPAPFLDRECVRTYRLPATDSCPSVELRPGDGIWVPVHGIHNDPKYFAEPDCFRPERFTPENKQLIAPFTYSPFGSGPRVCIAQRFAIMEAKTVLLYLTSQFNIEVVSKTPIPLKLDPGNSVSLSIKGGAWLGIRQRS
ncbi:cytochrome P450 9e2-like isoform X2 [Schistocerca gregaria]|uniref:cytochrome P450 9e2-like isoform X2 n=1 Tax=Schistocerca gregaria TaxID=7010 RepID=UPI00211DFFF1|nr:cytochrome P450 9e2-like isoform X2 [Schistocerca gregaria]XP_049855002.1 cytochrome P450 9e2-like isoform X2 [Schistocerca gregaria]